MKFINRILFTAMIGTIIISITSCKKKNSCVGASGGSLTFVFYPQHHGKPITNKPWHVDTVWVKYNSQNMPSSLSGYDAHFVGVPNTDNVHVPSLQCGDYYFFATGLDSTLDTTLFPHVTGGMPYSTTQTNGEIDINIPVSE